MRSDAELVAYYELRAKEYERIFQKPERQSDLELLRQLLIHALTGKNILEIACGTGYWTQLLAPHTESITALDINPEVLEIARSKKIEPSKVTFHQADVFALPTFHAPFSAGYAVFWWSHIPKSKIEGFLNQFHSQIMPGGKVIFIDNNYVEGNSTPLSRVDSDGNSYQCRMLDDGSTYEVLKNYPTEPELEKVLKGMADNFKFQSLNYYWFLEYTLV